MNGIFLKLSEVKRNPKQVFRKMRGKILKRKKRIISKALFLWEFAEDRTLSNAYYCTHLQDVRLFFPNKFIASVRIWLMGFCDMEVLQGLIVFLSSCCLLSQYQFIEKCHSAINLSFEEFRFINQPLSPSLSLFFCTLHGEVNIHDSQNSKG